MKISTYEYVLHDGSKDGYECDKCGGSSLEDNCGGLQERWFCKECYYDICFTCITKSGIVKGKSYS